MSALRHLIVAVLFAAAFFVTGGAAESASAAEVQNLGLAPGTAQRGVSLRDRLVVGLQARLPAEVAFVEAVAARVHTGQLPQRLVDETFFWSRQRATDGRYGRSRRAILYFRPAMAARARRLNVAL